MKKRQQGRTFIEYMIILSIIVVAIIMMTTPWIAEYAWNKSVPQMFGLKPITALQALHLILIIAALTLGAAGVRLAVVLGVNFVFVQGCGNAYLKWRDYRFKKRMAKRQAPSWHERTN